VVLARHLPVLVTDFDHRLLLLVGAVDDDLPREARDLVHFLVIRHVGDEVLVLHGARILGEDRERVRIPLDQDLARPDWSAVADLQAGAIDDGIPLAVATLVVLHDERPGPIHDDQLALRLLGAAPLGLDDLQTLIPDRAGVLGVERRLLRHPRRRPADMERPHRQLRAGLADGLRRDDADRETQLDQPPRRHIPADTPRVKVEQRTVDEPFRSAPCLQ
jgi:hypothetical protein